jgi:ABC-2 type transport system permease protein
MNSAIRSYLLEAKYECFRALRNPGFAIPFLLLPVGLYLLFGSFLFGDAMRSDPKATAGLFLSFSVMGIMGPGLFGFGAFLAVDREQGLLKLKRSLPTPRGAYLLAKMLMALLFAGLVMATMLVAAVTITHPPFSAGQMLLLAAVMILGALPFCALGLFVGAHTAGRSAPAYVNLVYLPMIYLSGFFFPLPKSFVWIEFASPAFYLNQVALSIAGAPHFAVFLSVAVLAGITLLLTSVATRRLERVG